MGRPRLGGHCGRTHGFLPHKLKSTAGVLVTEAELQASDKELVLQDSDKELILLQRNCKRRPPDVSLGAASLLPAMWPLQLFSWHYQLPSLPSVLLMLQLAAFFTPSLSQTLSSAATLVSFREATCFSSTFVEGTVQCTSTFPSLASSSSYNYSLIAEVVPTDFAQPSQAVDSIQINGHELLLAGSCVPSGQCAASAFYTCYQGDVTNYITAAQPVTLLAKASPAVQYPCSTCGTGSTLPCAVLITNYRLATVIYSPAIPSPPLPPASPPPPAPPPPQTTVPLVSFLATPSRISNVSSAYFKWEAVDLVTGLGCFGCSYQCQLDNNPPTSCSSRSFTARGIADGNHTFVLTTLSPTGSNVTTFGWLVDTQGPILTLSVAPNVTRQQPVTLTLIFSKGCTGRAVQCTVTSCDILVSAGMVVNTSSFQVLSPGTVYRVSLKVATNQSTTVSVGLAPEACVDAGGKAWVGSTSSSASVSIDISSPITTISCQVPVKVATFFEQPRSSSTTNQSQVACQVSFSKPVAGLNLASIHVANGTAANVSMLSSTLYTVQVLPRMQGPVAVMLLAGATSDIVGNPSTAANLSFFYDDSRATVEVATGTVLSSQDASYPFLVSFSKPVVNFTASSLQLTNGEVLCVAGADSGLGRYYEVTVGPLRGGSIQVEVPDGSISDASGNTNHESNTIVVTHYTESDGEKIAPYVVTGVFGWTALVTTSVTLAVAIREIDPSASPGIRIVSNRPFRAVSTPVVGADPARNLMRMAFHLQVFALSEHLAVGPLPVFYREVAKGLRWLYGYLPMPNHEKLFRHQPQALSVFPPSAPGVISTAASQPSCVSSSTLTSSSTTSFSSPPPPFETTASASTSSSQPTAAPAPAPSPVTTPTTVSRRIMERPSAVTVDLASSHGYSANKVEVPLPWQDGAEARPCTLLHSTLSNVAQSESFRYPNVSQVASCEGPVPRSHKALSTQARLSRVLLQHKIATGGTVLNGYPAEVYPALTVDEYYYQTAWGDSFSTNYLDLESSYHGFEQFCDVLFYSGAVVIGLSLLQLSAQLLCMLVRNQWMYGLLDPPRLQFYLIALTMAGVAWAATLIIIGSRQAGGHPLGLILGVVTLYVWPLALVFVSIVVVWVVVVQEQFARFFVREMTEPRAATCLPSLARLVWTALYQKRLKGHWVTIAPNERHILPRLGLFFEDFTVWGIAGFWGVLMDRLRALYAALEFLRMIAIGVLFAVWDQSMDTVLQPSLLLGITFVQLLYLVVCQPFTERGTQVVEALSLLCEAALFACALAIQQTRAGHNSAHDLAIAMLALAAASFVGQLFNHWVALVQQIGRMFATGEDEKTPSHGSEEEVYTDDEITERDIE